jgi:hypothetical protein
MLARAAMLKVPAARAFSGAAAQQVRCWTRASGQALGGVCGERGGELARRILTAACSLSIVVVVLLAMPLVLVLELLLW